MDFFRWLKWALTSSYTASPAVRCCNRTGNTNELNAPRPLALIMRVPRPFYSVLRRQLCAHPRASAHPINIKPPRKALSLPLAALSVPVKTHQPHRMAKFSPRDARDSSPCGKANRKAHRPLERHKNSTINYEEQESSPEAARRRQRLCRWRSGQEGRPPGRGPPEQGARTFGSAATAWPPPRAAARRRLPAWARRPRRQAREGRRAPRAGARAGH